MVCKQLRIACQEDLQAKWIENQMHPELDKKELRSSSWQLLHGLRLVCRSVFCCFFVCGRSATLTVAHMSPVRNSLSLKQSLVALHRNPISTLGKAGAKLNACAGSSGECTSCLRSLVFSGQCQIWLVGPYVTQPLHGVSSHLGLGPWSSS